MGQQSSTTEGPKPKVSVSGQIPWDRTSTIISDGYDSKKYRTRQTAFVDPPEIESPSLRSGAVMKFNSYVMRTEDELEKGIKFSCNISAPVCPGTSAEASLDYFRSITCNATNMELPSQKGVSAPRLTPEADALPAINPRMFTERYGQYFVSGQHSRSTLIAVCSLSASSKEQLDSLKAKLGVNFEVSNLEVAAEYMKKVKSTYLSIKIDILIHGYNSKNGLRHFTTPETNFMPTLREFQKGYTPVPYPAPLTDYSYVDSRAPVQNERFALPADLNEAFQKVCLIS